MTDQPDLRAQLALALEREDALHCGYDHGFASTYGLDAETDGFVDAALAAVQPHLEQQKQRADTAEAKVADYENRITWGTSCGSCARVLDSSIRETERRERAEAALTRVRSLHHEEYGCCAECTNSHVVLYPCPTITALAEPAPAPAATPAADKPA